MSISSKAFPSITTYVVYEKYSIPQDKESMGWSFIDARVNVNLSKFMCSFLYKWELPEHGPSQTFVVELRKNINITLLVYINITIICYCKTIKKQMKRIIFLSVYKPLLM